MEEKVKILKMMNEATGRMDLNEFARTIDLTTKQTIEQMDFLTKTEHLKKTGGGYGITEKGKTTLRAYVTVPEKMEFYFYIGIGQPTEFKAKTLKEFYEQLKIVDIASLEFHLYRGDFENWVRNAVSDLPLAEEFSKIQSAKLYGNNLREKLVRAMETKYHLENF